MNRTSDNHEDPRLAEIPAIIFKFAAGDFTAGGTLADDDSPLAGVMAGINVLGEALETKVVEIRLALEN